MVNTDSSNNQPTRIEKIENRVGYLEGWLRAITGHMQEDSQRVSDLEGQTKNLSDSTEKRFQEVDERMEDLDGRVTNAQYSADRAQGTADGAMQLGYSAHARITNTNNNLKTGVSLVGGLGGAFLLFKYVIPGIQEVLTYNYCKLSVNLTSPNCLEYNLTHLTPQGTIEPSENYAIGQLSLLVLGAAILIGGYYLNMRKRDNKMIEQAINS